MKTFYFNTGVNPLNFRDYKLSPGHVIRGGTVQIPFDCEDVPESAVFRHACDNPHASPGHIAREIRNSAMVSKFAHFWTGETSRHATP